MRRLRRLGNGCVEWTDWRGESGRGRAKTGGKGRGTGGRRICGKRDKGEREAGTAKVGEWYMEGNDWLRGGGAGQGRAGKAGVLEEGGGREGGAKDGRRKKGGTESGVGKDKSGMQAVGCSAGAVCFSRGIGWDEWREKSLRFYAEAVKSLGMLAGSCRKPVDEGLQYSGVNSAGQDADKHENGHQDVFIVNVDVDIAVAHVPENGPKVLILVLVLVLALALVLVLILGLVLLLLLPLGLRLPVRVCPTLTAGGPAAAAALRKATTRHGHASFLGYVL